MNCPKCGAQIPDNATYCGYCGQSIQQPMQQPVYQQPMYEQPVYQQPTYQQPVQQQNAPVEKKENVVLGVVGALVGALLGAVVIVLFLQMNMVASLSGLVLAICTLKGYELLGRKLSTVGIIICVVLMLIVPYVANDVSCALLIADEFNMDFMDAYESIEEAENLGILQGRGETLGTLYAFTILGGAAYVFTAFKNRKK